MRLPRWLVTCLLSSSATAVFIAAAWWWITWPTRTVREFTSLLEQGHFDQASQLLKPPARLRIDASETREKVVVEGGQSFVVRMESVSLYSPESWRSWCTLENLETERRSFSDLLLGRHGFSYHHMFTTPFFIGGTAERGTISLQCENWAAPAF